MARAHSETLAASAGGLYSVVAAVFPAGLAVELFGQMIAWQTVDRASWA